MTALAGATGAVVAAVTLAVLAAAVLLDAVGARVARFAWGLAVPLALASAVVVVARFEVLR